MSSPRKNSGSRKPSARSFTSPDRHRHRHRDDLPITPTNAMIRTKSVLESLEDPQVTLSPAVAAAASQNDDEDKPRKKGLEYWKSRIQSHVRFKNDNEVGDDDDNDNYDPDYLDAGEEIDDDIKTDQNDGGHNGGDDDEDANLPAADNDDAASDDSFDEEKLEEEWKPVVWGDSDYAPNEQLHCRRSNKKGLSKTNRNPAEQRKLQQKRHGAVNTMVKTRPFAKASADTTSESEEDEQPCGPRRRFVKERKMSSKTSQQQPTHKAKAETTSESEASAGESESAVDQPGHARHVTNSVSAQRQPSAALAHSSSSSECSLSSSASDDGDSGEEQLTAALAKSTSSSEFRISSSSAREDDDLEDEQPTKPATVTRAGQTFRVEQLENYVNNEPSAKQATVTRAGRTFRVEQLDRSYKPSTSTNNDGSGHGSSSDESWSGATSGSVDVDDVVFDEPMERSSKSVDTKPSGKVNKMIKRRAKIDEAKQKSYESDDEGCKELFGEHDRKVTRTRWLTSTPTSNNKKSVDINIAAKQARNVRDEVFRKSTTPTTRGQPLLRSAVGTTLREQASTSLSSAPSSDERNKIVSEQSKRSAKSGSKDMTKLVPPPTINRRVLNESFVELALTNVELAKSGHESVVRSNIAKAHESLTHDAMVDATDAVGDNIIHTAQNDIQPLTNADNCNRKLNSDDKTSLDRKPGVDASVDTSRDEILALRAQADDMTISKLDSELTTTFENAPLFTLSKTAPGGDVNGGGTIAEPPRHIHHTAGADNMSVEDNEPVNHTAVMELGNVRNRAMPTPLLNLTVDSKCGLTESAGRHNKDTLCREVDDGYERSLRQPNAGLCVEQVDGKCIQRATCPGIGNSPDFQDSVGTDEISATAEGTEGAEPWSRSLEDPSRSSTNDAAAAAADDDDNDDGVAVCSETGSYTALTMRPDEVLMRTPRQPNQVALPSHGVSPAQYDNLSVDINAQSMTLDGKPALGALTDRYIYDRHQYVGAMNEVGQGDALPNECANVEAWHEATVHAVKSPQLIYSSKNYDGADLLCQSAESGTGACAAGCGAQCQKYMPCNASSPEMAFDRMHAHDKKVTAQAQSCPNDIQGVMQVDALRSMEIAAVKPTERSNDNSSDFSCRPKSNEELYSHRPTFLSANVSATLFDVYDEYKGLGEFHNIPVRGGISGLLGNANVRRGKRRFHEKFGGTTHGKFKTIIMLVDALDQQADREGLPAKTLLEIVEGERLRRLSSEDPFGWIFLKEYVGYGGRRTNDAEIPAKRKRQISCITVTKRHKCKQQEDLTQDIVVSRPKCRKKDDGDGGKPPHKAEIPNMTLLSENLAVPTPEDDGAREHWPQKPYVSTASLSTNSCFVEETAFLYHDPPDGVKLSPLLPPPPRPAIPHSLACRWSYNGPDSRTLLANFKGLRLIPKADKEFYQQAMQCDHIVVISDGLLDIKSLSDSFIWTREGIVSEIGKNNFFHKFRLFVKEQVVYRERDGYIYMKISDYMRYLKLREDVDQADLSGSAGLIDRSFSYTCNDEFCLDANGEACPGHLLQDVAEATVYMTDLELPTYIHRLDEKFNRAFKLPEILPGGDWCIMNAMTPSTRPFMGPNLYICPPGGFTHIHQDGHGSVDSAHLCVQGSNDVFLLRRLTERHKQNAVDILNRTVGGTFDPLYNLPHDDKNVKPPWIKKQTIDEMDEMNYVPICISLKAGQCIHLNKGRLHAFRKGTRDVLPKDDCHYELRNELIKSLGDRPAETCISIAWDWNFFGSDPEGINREVASMVEASQRCRQKKRKALAPTGRAVLGMGAYIRDTHGMSDRLLQSDNDIVYAPDKRLKTIARGILPSLKFLVQREMASFQLAKTAANLRRSMQTSRKRQGHELCQADEPDIHKDPMSSAIDARGNDYYCQLCFAELANVYYRCNGCESLFGRDYIICTDCFVEGTFAKPPEEDDADDAPHAASHIVHCGYLHGDVKGSCRGQDCIACRICGYGTCCSCRCHSNFTMHMRMAMPDKLGAMVQDVANIVGHGDGDNIPHAEATLIRLHYGADPRGARPAYDELCRLVAETDPIYCENVPDQIRQAAFAVAADAAAANADVISAPAPANADTPTPFDADALVDADALAHDPADAGFMPAPADVEVCLETAAV